MRMIFACLLAVAVGLPAQSPEDFSFDEFEKLHASLVPTNEIWKTIPWEVDLLAAQRKAADEDKLLFIWAMDGHPLGCT